MFVLDVLPTPDSEEPGSVYLKLSTLQTKVMQSVRFNAFMVDEIDGRDIAFVMPKVTPLPPTPSLEIPLTVPPDSGLMTRLKPIRGTWNKIYRPVCGINLHIAMYDDVTRALSVENIGFKTEISVLPHAYRYDAYRFDAEERSDGPPAPWQDETKIPCALRLSDTVRVACTLIISRNGGANVERSDDDVVVDPFIEWSNGDAPGCVNLGSPVGGGTAYDPNLTLEDAIETASSIASSVVRFAACVYLPIGYVIRHLTKGASAAMTAILTVLFARRGVMGRARDFYDEPKAPFVGGYSVPVVTGMTWPGVHVVSLDVVSMYPSLIVAHRLCLLPNERRDVPSFVRASEKTYAVVPSLVGDLLELRRSPSTSPVMATAFKLMANCVYGLFASNRFDFFWPQLSASVATLGRIALSVCVREMGPRLASMRASVVGGFTDNILVAHPGTARVGSELAKTATECCARSGVRGIVFRVEDEYDRVLTISTHVRFSLKRNGEIKRSGYVSNVGSADVGINNLVAEIAGLALRSRTKSGLEDDDGTEAKIESVVSSWFEDLNKEYNPSDVRFTFLNSMKISCVQVHEKGPVSVRSIPPSHDDGVRINAPVMLDVDWYTKRAKRVLGQLMQHSSLVAMALRRHVQPPRTIHPPEVRLLEEELSNLSQLDLEDYARVWDE